MGKALGAVILRLLMGALSLAMAGQEPHEVLHDVPYAPKGALPPNPLQTLDLYLPAKGRRSKAPTLMFIHGGAWVSGDKSAYEHIGTRFSELGLGVAVIDYRLSNDGKTKHPEHAQDGAAAYAWLRKHLKDHGLNPGDIFIMGHSAGAHMAAALAFSPKLLFDRGEDAAAVKGFIGLEGVYDLPDLVKIHPAYKKDFVESAFGSDSELWAQASPGRWNGTSSVPWLVVHSKADELVEFSQSENFAAALKQKIKAPAQAELFAKVSKSHFGMVQDLGLKDDPLTAEIMKFIRANETSR